ncbi:MAG: hypothetical protein AAFP13_04930 [Pseudomonadota bacterium]
MVLKTMVKLKMLGLAGQVVTGAFINGALIGAGVTAAGLMAAKAAKDAGKKTG